ncbi:hypothetical protein N7532_003627 [Penicillium argentinense]|uniref:Uncharacterized protein n=1 Tax=Penicillium argentinense TaxID=1131581 RepID=A0A9W9FMZ9_9EURO|nr:uncharacterized protein N7532_003627 [Penicillium argentinense]KAJ5103098.1 hypothetical protein N7532_003627 [Penicillium argentinense]
MTTVSVAGGLWTFQNNGPVTTTYTPDPSCTATSRLSLGTIDSDNFPHALYQVDCATTKFTDCVPSVTATPTGLFNEDDWVGVGSYYSPGLYCPSGWEAIAQAARDGDKAYTTSGAMSLAESDRIPYFAYVPTLLASVLQPSETVALCCPSGFTADILGGCFSTVPSYTPTGGCYVYEHTYHSYGTSTSVFTEDGTIMSEKYITATSDFPTHTTYTTSWASDDDFAGFYTPISYVSAVTLIHHESDLKVTDTSEVTVSGTANSTATGTATSTSTSNAAGRLEARSSSWNGFGSILDVTAAVALLGAAIIL